MALTRICPSCGLVNGPDTLRCDCGWDFVTRRREPPNLGTSPSARTVVAESEALRSELGASGYAVKHIRANEFELSLPLWCSVRVTVGSGGLQQEPLFGLVPRSTALLLTGATLALVAVTAAAYWQSNFWALGLVLLFAVAWDVCRYIMTERAMAGVREAHRALAHEGAPGGNATGGESGVSSPNRPGR